MRCHLVVPQRVRNECLGPLQTNDATTKNILQVHRCKHGLIIMTRTSGFSNNMPGGGCVWLGEGGSRDLRGADTGVHQADVELTRM